VARHAQANAVRMVVSIGDGKLAVSVADNGVGLNTLAGSHTDRPHGARGAAERGGLANMRERAAGHGGNFAVRPVEPRGTVIEWSVPV
jgi:signal transduction histidine kinase